MCSGGAARGEPRGRNLGDVCARGRLANAVRVFACTQQHCDLSVTCGSVILIFVCLTFIVRGALPPGWPCGRVASVRWPWRQGGKCALAVAAGWRVRLQFTVAVQQGGRAAGQKGGRAFGSDGGGSQGLMVAARAARAPRKATLSAPRRLHENLPFFFVIPNGDCRIPKASPREKHNLMMESAMA